MKYVGKSSTGGSVFRKAVETLNQSYSTKEQAERYGKQEADKLTRRGYPTRFVGVKEEQVTTETQEHEGGGYDSRRDPHSVRPVGSSGRHAHTRTVYKPQIETTE